MQDNLLEAKLEALLFVYGEAFKIKTLAEKLDAPETAIKEAINQLKKDLDAENRGLSLIILDDRIELVTKPSLSYLIQKVIKDEFDSDLTAASLETLAIIAYLGPCSRAEIDYIRGVNSSFILRNLAIRGLVERKIDSHRANAFIYNVSFDFLKHIGVDSLQSLPDYGKYRDLVNSFINPVRDRPAENTATTALGQSVSNGVKKENEVSEKKS
ncbi:MAG: SMC-Scp complex subunit ScpB [Candidatus Colwellbacteria bacterium CG23_combo_of_CG06-09_8_20_14_all_42_19]|uniref:SMC-Scp complex subunit ScpB n=1 Tax=Candidatus Colwellbacteria bacterium CG23_combo_of_CG06-09_8_20_14_all_42_19 TaxID=1974541 RepID=A0A2H0AMN6_9BACT|nr:MAG: SMC-Scp complex subunit ScpB [Candidatus Colwellbacteria bacterium CG23_combo_of_CG06-09_8_20_14_all_42_19]